MHWQRVGKSGASPTSFSGKLSGMISGMPGLNRNRGIPFFLKLFLILKLKSINIRV